jgi:hypothetical protein
MKQLPNQTSNYSQVGFGHCQPVETAPITMHSYITKIWILYGWFYGIVRRKPLD